MDLCHWDKSVETEAYGCDKKPLKMHGIMTIPNLSINKQELGVKASFWVLEDATDEVIMSADWMKQLGAKIDFQEERMTYSKPGKDLQPDNVTLQANPNYAEDTKEPTHKKHLLPEEGIFYHRKNIEENKVCRITTKSKNIIKPHRAVTITLTQEQGKTISKICTGINKANNYVRNTENKKEEMEQVRIALAEDGMSKAIYLPPMDPPDITQPVTVNNMPGLLTKQQKGRKYVRLIIPNVSATAIKLPQNLNIKPREPPQFLKMQREEDINRPEQTVMQIGPKWKIIEY